MTRETKIGLMVAVSFISLVGIVVATRWRRDNNPNQIADIKPQEPKPAPGGDNPPPSGGGNNKNPVVQVGGFNNQAPGALPIGADNTPPLVSIGPSGGANNADPTVPALPALPMVGDVAPPPPQIGGSTPPSVVAAPPLNIGGNNAGSAGINGINLPAPPPIGGNDGPPPPSANNSAVSSFPPAPFGSDDAKRAQLQTLKNEQERQFAQLKPGDDSNKNLPLPPTGANLPPTQTPTKDNNVPFPSAPPGNNMPPALPQNKDNNIPFPAAPTLPQTKDNNVPFPAAPTPNNSAPTLPQTKDNNVPFPAAPTPNNAAPTLAQTKDNNVPFPAPPTPNNTVRTLPQTKDSNVPFPAAPTPNNSPPTLPQTKDNNVPFPVASQGNNSAPPIPAPKNADVPFPTASGAQGGNVFSGVPAPQSSNNFNVPTQGSGNPGFGPSSLGANLKNTSNPGFTIPAPNAAGASVESYDMRKYVVRGGETFPGLSNYFYQSEKYADALLAFNRDQGNPGLSILQPGQTILAPSADYLQRTYGSLIAGNRAGASGASVAINQPVPLAPKTNFGAGSPSPDATKSYRVSGESQMIWQVAVQTLGDGNRWPEILRLNPGLQTLQPIPGGTVLRMPGNANVP